MLQLLYGLSECCPYYKKHHIWGKYLVLTMASQSQTNIQKTIDISDLEYKEKYGEAVFGNIFLLQMSTIDVTMAIFDNFISQRCARQVPRMRDNYNTPWYLFWFLGFFCEQMILLNILRASLWKRVVFCSHYNDHNLPFEAKSDLTYPIVIQSASQMAWPEDALAFRGMCD